MPVDLSECGINTWEEIKEDFEGADILLGNGFSIMINPLFNYKSLFEKFLENLNPDERKIFSKFKTSNFENILTKLKNAEEVNIFLDLPTSPIKESSLQLKNGLIKAVQQCHPIANNLNIAYLFRLSEIFDGFGDIYTLNYDALIYHIIMHSKDRHDYISTVRPYNDYFWEQYNEDFLLHKDFQNIPFYKHVYFLHGALFIFHWNDKTLKIKRKGDVELLDRISRAIKEDLFPLFITEGTAEDKLLGISQSSYLQFCLRNLKDRERPMVIFGASLSSPDMHIVNAIKNKIHGIAYGIHLEGKSKDDVMIIKSKVKALFGRREIVFYDSSSLFPVLS